MIELQGLKDFYEKEVAPRSEKLPKELTDRQLEILSELLDANSKMDLEDAPKSVGDGIGFTEEEIEPFIESFTREQNIANEAFFDGKKAIALAAYENSLGILYAFSVEDIKRNDYLFEEFFYSIDVEPEEGFEVLNLIPEYMKWSSLVYFEQRLDRFIGADTTELEIDMVRKVIELEENEEDYEDFDDEE